jgi:hypothetical protein
MRSVLGGEVAVLICCAAVRVLTFQRQSIAGSCAGMTSHPLALDGLARDSIGNLQIVVEEGLQRSPVLYWRPDDATGSTELGAARQELLISRPGKRCHLDSLAARLLAQLPELCELGLKLGNVLDNRRPFVP